MVETPASGWLILDKPRGLGSTQAVGAVKRALREAGEPKTKVGHGGTLDPLASTRRFIVALRPQWHTAFSSTSASEMPSSAAEPSKSSPWKSVRNP